jgi:hypothetical protein
VVVALVFLLGGFGVTWLLVGSSRRHPAMWDCWSGTVGDGLLLPLVVYGLTRGCSLLADEGRAPSPWSFLGGLVGAGLGGASQLAWFAGPDPRLNWMLVRAHTFSLIGWYHTGFVTLAGCYVAGAVVEILLRARRAGCLPSRRPIAAGASSASWRAAVLAGNGAALVVTAAALFVVAVLADSSPSASTSSSTVTMTGVVVAPALALAAAWAILGGGVRLVAGPVMVGACIAVSVLVLAHDTGPTAPVVTVAVVGATLAGIGFGIDLFSGGHVLRSQDVRLLLPPAVSLLAVSVATRLPPGGGVGLLVLLVVNTLVLTLGDSWRDSPRGRTLWAAFATSFLVLVAAGGVAIYQHDSLRALGSGMATVFYAVALGVVVERRVKDAWQSMVDAETMHDHGLADRPAAGLPRKMLRAWLVGVPTGLGGFLAFVPLVYEAVGANLRFGGATSGAHEWVVVVASGVGGLGLALPLVAMMFADQSSHVSRDDPPGRRRASAPARCAGWLALAALLGSMSWLAIGRAGWHGPLSMVTVLVCGLYAIDCFESTVVDSSVLCLRWPTRLDYTVSMFAGMTGAAALYWSLLCAAGEGGLRLPSALMVFAAAAAARVVTCVVAGGLVYGRGERLSAIYLPVWWVHVQ